MTKFTEQLNVNELISSNVIDYGIVKYDEIRIIDKGDGAIEQEFLYQGKKICYREKKGEFPGINIDY